MDIKSILTKTQTDLRGVRGRVCSDVIPGLNENLRQQVVSRIDAQLDLIDFLFKKTEEQEMQETQETQENKAAKHNVEALNDLVLNDKKSADDFYEYAYAFLSETYRNIRKFANKAANPTCSSVNARKWKLIDLLEGELWGICQEWRDIKPSEDDLKHNT